MRRLGRAALAALLVVAVAPTPARASTYDIFGLSARDVAMGNAMTAAATGYAAVYYNPAALTATSQQQIGLGLTLTLPEVYVDRGSADSDRPTVLPPSHFGLALGWMKPVPGVFAGKLALGVGLYLPGDRLVRVQGVDPQRPQFYLYQNLQDKLLIHAAAAVEVTEWLSIGAGVEILADLGGSVALDMNILSGEFEQRNLSVTLDPTAAPIAGIHIRPAEGVAIGLSYRGESALSFHLPIRVSDGEALSLAVDVEQTVLWTPHQLSLGASWTLTDPALTLALDATLAFWSGAPDPSPRLSVDVEGYLLEAFGLAGALDLSTHTAPIAVGFTDTVTARVGAEWQATPWLTLRGGYFYRPTPAPRQTGVTAYLDNDAHVLSLGAGFDFLSPLKEAPTAVRLDLAAQLTLLPRRTALRADAKDPVGDLSHGGHLWTFVMSLSHAY
ncbi:MAG: outer membrane protein transport protein [Myxococcales bacterium]|nr:outer membrane protein transport protein [Myxococcales bacterium]MCB9736387.1 outer membrane protein transport protein [Deltaproteobacteria bacterium]